MALIRSFPQLRSLAWRTGRKLYCAARGDLANDPEKNGEYWLLKKVIESLSSNPAPALLDVGANLGDWSAEAMRLSENRVDIRIHAFEPSTATREMLLRRFSTVPAVRIHPQALSDIDGSSTFYSKEAGGGTNSLDPISGHCAETVHLLRLDSFLMDERVTSVSMIKIDTEGFDLLVMKGAEQTLSQGKCEVVQFEYNWRWLINHASLRDVFRLISAKPYRLGKLIGSSIEFYDDWHFELDRYFESNYVLVRKGSAFEDLGKRVKFGSSNVAV